MTRSDCDDLRGDPPPTTPRTAPEAPGAPGAEERLGLLRILDANGNRAGEGLRVVEEYLRFVLEDTHLARLAKQLRHDLRGGLERLGPARLAARDAAGDVGATIHTAQESTRSGSRDIVEANFKRTEQALRCLEEYAKPLDAEAAACFEALRYRAYTLARAVSVTTQATERLAAAQLYLLTDGADSPRQFEDRIRMLAPHVDLIQLRDKRLSDRELLERAKQARALTRDTAMLLLVNDRPDLARLCQADGVHLGQDDLPVREARRIVGAEALVGVSTHSLDQARQAVLDGADYIGCGPTFASQTKAFEDFAGIDFLRAVHAEIRLPSFAIGGIDCDNVGEVLACGFRRIAVSAALTAGAEPAGAARELRRRLRAATPPPAGRDGRH